MLNEPEARRALMKALQKDACYHEQGLFNRVGEDFDKLDGEIPRTIHDKHFWIAFTFWECWVDQCNHGFYQQFYDGIGKEDWPVFAREIAQCLERQEVILNPVVLQQFDLSSQGPGFFERLRNWIKHMLG